MEDTIVAIATAYGEGGIGIVRVSGPRARSVLESIFISVRRHRTEGEGQGERFFLPEATGETINEPIVNRRLTYGNVLDPKDGSLVDEAMAVFMKAPYTYTAEDVAEIQCHGSVVSLRRVLSLCLENGARLAEPGEFTKRAFLNGRLDLSQAEAVIDVVRAKTDQSFDVALGQMEGSLSREIRELRNDLTDLLVLVTVNLDYPDEDIEEINYEKLDECLSQIDDKLQALIAGAGTGRMIREGLAVTIAGRPNVGKSSLMNALLRESRAIVTDVPGTTRDTIEEGLSISGIPVRLTDTAGIRRTEDRVEQIGIEKSKEAVNRADLILFMVSGNEGFTREDLEIIPYLDEKKTVVLLNKIDLGSVLTEEMILEKMPGATVIETSMKEGHGMDLLQEKIRDMVFGGQAAQRESMIVTNVRHEELIRRASEEIHSAQLMSSSREALDFIEVNIRQAFDDLGEIIGETANDQIINEVFARFCLGK